MRVTILGGGFGLYGYLPALLQSCQATVILPTRYQEHFKARDDIRSLSHKIEWLDDQETILSLCDAVVFALPPEQQFKWVQKSLAHKNISHLFLEKPLASTPQLGHALLDQLESSGKKFRIGFNFRYTDWGKALLNNTHPIHRIQWHFRAHHYANNIQTWKRSHTTGGGALRFYGIHLIALLAEAGYCNVNLSRIQAKQTDEVENWQAELTGANLPVCQLSVHTNSDDTRFLVANNSGSLYADLQPFQVQKNTNDIMDKRIPYLVEGLLDLFQKENAYYPWYRQANLLWSNIETSHTGIS